MLCKARGCYTNAQTAAFRELALYVHCERD